MAKNKQVELPPAYTQGGQLLTPAPAVSNPEVISDNSLILKKIDELTNVMLNNVKEINIIKDLIAELNCRLTAITDKLNASASIPAPTPAPMPTLAPKAVKYIESVGDVSGIGEKSRQILEEKGFKTATQLYGKFLILLEDTGAFDLWLQEQVPSMNAKHRSDCIEYFLLNYAV